jgi:hypothetical protein
MEGVVDDHVWDWIVDAADCRKSTLDVRADRVLVNPAD